MSIEVQFLIRITLHDRINWRNSLCKMGIIYLIIPFASLCSSWTQLYSFGRCRTVRSKLIVLLEGFEVAISGTRNSSLIKDSTETVRKINWVKTNFRQIQIFYNPFPSVGLTCIQKTKYAKGQEKLSNPQRSNNYDRAEDKIY